MVGASWYQQRYSDTLVRWHLSVPTDTVIHLWDDSSQCAPSGVAIALNMTSVIIIWFSRDQAQLHKQHVKVMSLIPWWPGPVNLYFAVDFHFFIELEKCLISINYDRIGDWYHELVSDTSLSVNNTTIWWVVQVYRWLTVWFDDWFIRIDKWHSDSVSDTSVSVSDSMIRCVIKAYRWLIAWFIYWLRHISERYSVSMSDTKSIGDW